MIAGFRQFRDLIDGEKIFVKYEAKFEELRIFESCV